MEIFRLLPHGFPCLTLAHDELRIPKGAAADLDDRLHSGLGYRTPQEVMDEFLNGQEAALFNR
jgi:hypothetical protein